MEEETVNSEYEEVRGAMPVNDPLAEEQVRLEDLTKADAQRIWREADAVCFDVDSTVITEEGIDELAKFCGVGQQVKQM